MPRYWVIVQPHKGQIYVLPLKRPQPFDSLKCSVKVLKPLELTHLQLQPLKSCHQLFHSLDFNMINTFTN